MSRWNRWIHPWLARPVVLLLTVGVLAACGTQVVNPVTGKTERTVMDESTEIAEGRKAHQQVLAEYGVIKDARLQAYVNDIGQRLAKQSHRAQLPWTFTVLDSAEVNAFALPGGFIYITRGIMAYLDSEAELAGVLGHEIGHVTARHGAQRATREQAAGLGVFAATVLGAVLEAKGVGGAVDLASQASQVAAAGFIARYSREQELQADQLGADYLARNRYNPQNMVDVIAVLKNQEVFAADQARAEGRQIAQGSHWLASHPSSDTRLIAIRETAAKLAAGQFGDDYRNRYHSAIEGMTIGDSREQGVVRGRNFYHEDLGLALTAPAGWRVENSAEAITLVNGAGEAGLIVKLLPPNAGTTHDEIIRNVIKPTQGQVERRQLNGLAATHFAGQVRNAQGQAQDVRVTVATGPGNRNYLLLYAARNAAAMQRAAAGLVQAEASFRALTAADRAAARPWVLRTVPFPRGGWDELARNSPLGERATAQLRLINGAYGAGADPRVGTAVKMVQ